MPTHCPLGLSALEDISQILHNSLFWFSRFPNLN
jgi:hypothetical protein